MPNGMVDHDARDRITRIEARAEGCILARERAEAQIMADVERLFNRLNQVNNNIGDLKSSVNGMKSAMNTWKVIIPILSLGVGFLAMLFTVIKGMT